MTLGLVRSPSACAEWYAWFNRTGSLFRQAHLPKRTGGTLKVSTDFRNHPVTVKPDTNTRSLKTEYHPLRAAAELSTQPHF